MANTRTAKSTTRRNTRTTTRSRSSKTASSSPSAEQVAVLAYEKWCARGRPDGGDLQDWLEAEAELAAKGNGRKSRRK